MENKSLSCYSLVYFSCLEIGFTFFSTFVATLDVFPNGFSCNVFHVCFDLKCVFQISLSFQSVHSAVIVKKGERLGKCIEGREAKKKHFISQKFILETEK